MTRSHKLKFKIWNVSTCSITTPTDDNNNTTDNIEYNNNNNTDNTKYNNNNRTEQQLL